jgi:anti-sigma B factor antagonist
MTEPVKKLLYSSVDTLGGVFSVQSSMSRIEPDIAVVHLSGSLSAWPESLPSLPHIEELLQQNERKLIIDLSGVEHIDSSGLQVIFDAFSQVRKAGGALRLAGANDRVARPFKLTRLDTILPFYPSVSAASQDFEIVAQASD